MSNSKSFTIFFLIFLMGATFSAHAQISNLSFASDLISSSIPDALANHTVQFTATNAIPASGTIVITPEAGVFSIPAAFDFNDVDLAVSSGGGPFTDRSLAASASATNDGVSVVSGSSGSITITMNSSEGIGAGDRVRIKLGTHAGVGGVGEDQISNPSSAGSHRITIETNTAGGSLIDRGRTLVAIIQPVAVGVEVVPGPTTRFNGLPSGELAPGNSTIEISLNTVVPAVCRYSTSSGVPYVLMTNTFSITGSIVHAATIEGHENDTSYAYYVRCLNEEDIVNEDDFIISFSIAPPYPEPTPSGVSGSGGAGSFRQGSDVLFLSSVLLSGWSSPQSTITIVKDGEQHGTTQAGADGVFQYTVNNIERGTYSFMVRATDRQQRETSSFTSTLTVVQGTQNTLASIVLSPTISLEQDTIEVGQEARVLGAGIPGSIVELSVDRSGSLALGDASRLTATTTLNGVWDMVVGPDGLSRGTYEVRARMVMSEFLESNFSKALFLGVGEDPSPDFALRADINGDGKVSLVDFSILLSFWGTDHADSDINGDGIVNLADVSILLFHWTG